MLENGVYFIQSSNYLTLSQIVKTAKASQPQPVKTESRYEKLRSRKGLKSSNKSAASSSSSSSHTTSEPGFFSKLFSSSGSSSSSKKEQDVLNLAADAIGGNKTLNKGINSKETDANAKGGNNTLTYVFYCLIIVFFIYLLIVDQEKQFGKPDVPDPEV